MKQFLLPDPGEGLVEAEIIEWHVQVGDEVKVNDVVVEVETSKSIVELPIPWAGTVKEILVQPGTTVEVGTPIVIIDDGSGDEVSTPEPTAQPEREPNLVGYGAAEGSTRRRARRAVEKRPEETRGDLNRSLESKHGRPAEERTPLAPAVPMQPGAPLPSPGEGPDEPHGGLGPVLAKPPVRKLARDLGVDLHEVTPSSPDGLISREDVLAHAEATQDREAEPQRIATVTAIGNFGQEERVPIKGVRKATAEAMVASVHTAVHTNEWVQIDVTRTVELIDRLKEHRSFRDTKLTALAFIAKVVSSVLPRHRMLNSSWDEENREVVLHPTIDLGIAVAGPRGLLVPKVRNAHALSLAEMAEGIDAVAKLARAGKAQPSDLARGTFTITNVGVFGIDGGTPILTPGEAAILAVGQIVRRPWVVGTGADEQIVPRWVMSLSLAFDHRIVDGEQGSLFLAEVARILEDPGWALAL
ncbi:dihydrolipoamide acetyltransferase family protein [Enemella sp. A6]|uniref:dihydrolipoamide acetyltransferase family protein n=1 Tax=Enemella sp. A6 TaxID=3440152 RepID=UPI003EB8950E